MPESTQRIAVTGMSVNTPIGDTLDSFIDALLAGRSALTRWKGIDCSAIYSKVGGDLSDYDIASRLAGFESCLPQPMFGRLAALIKRVPWSTKLSLLLAADAWVNAGLATSSYDSERVGVIVGGHNINQNYAFDNYAVFADEPDFIEGLMALHGLDTTHAGAVSEMLQAHGPIFTVGAACASGNMALRAAIDEIRHHGSEVVLVVGPVLDLAPTDLQGMAIMGAISYESFNDEPARASRPFDKRREGFVPAHGGAALVLEDYERARDRGARLHAEVLGAAAGADGCHLPQPSKQGQVRAMKRVLAESGLAPEDVDYISAHATSTPLGDLTEIESIKDVFGPHAARLKINAPKSMLGHTCWAAPTVESVAAILQLQRGRLHPSINIDEIDDAIDLDVCANRAVDADVEICMKNSFGFGGINCVSLFRRTADTGGEG